MSPVACRSVFKLHLLTDAELAFVLTNGGHNAGILFPLFHESGAPLAQLNRAF